MSPRWRLGPMPAIRTGMDQGAKYYTFDLASAKMLVNFLVDNAFLVVGSDVYRQVKGIPMGIGPAMYFANFTLFFFEFMFFRDALVAFSAATAGLQRDTIKRCLLAFQFVARYADDEVIINRRPAHDVGCLFYTDQTHVGLHGIYPPSLRLKSSTIGQARVLHALDVEVLPANEVSGPLITRLFDKRKSPQFSNVVAVMRFPAADSMLAWSCKLNVFDAQFVRFSRIITDGENFRAEIVRLLVEMISAGYPRVTLLLRCRRRCNITAMLFGMARGTAAPQVGRPVRGLYARITNDVIAALPWIVS